MKHPIGGISIGGGGAVLLHSPWLRLRRGKFIKASHGKFHSSTACNTSVGFTAFLSKIFC